MRTGFRLDDGGQVTQADSYGRPFDTETFGTDFDTVANPELHLRWAVARGSTAELGLEWRAYLPIENGSRFGMMFGLPIALRAGLAAHRHRPLRPDHLLRSDTRRWSACRSTVDPGDADALAGTAVRAAGLQQRRRDRYPLGFGLGTSLTHLVDLRTWILFPDISRNEAARTFGAGVALQLRFG